MWKGVFFSFLNNRNNLTRSKWPIFCRNGDDEKLSTKDYYQSNMKDEWYGWYFAFSSKILRYLGDTIFHFTLIMWYYLFGNKLFRKKLKKILFEERTVLGRSNDRKIARKYFRKSHRFYLFDILSFGIESQTYRDFFFREMYMFAASVACSSLSILISFSFFFFFLNRMCRILFIHTSHQSKFFRLNAMKLRLILPVDSSNNFTDFLFSSLISLSVRIKIL